MAVERERIREREAQPEVIMMGPDAPYCFASREEEKKHLASLPRVLHMDQAPEYRHPWVTPDTSSSALQTRAWPRGLQVFLEWRYNNYKELKYPIYTLTAMLNPGKSNALRPGEWSGHRHFMEAMFYFPGGAGWEDQDGLRWEWEGEGVCLVPTYAVHRHAITKGTDRGLFAVISRVFENLGIADFEQANPAAIKIINEATKGKWPEWYGAVNPKLEGFVHGMRKATKWEGGEPKGVYDRYLKTLVDNNNRWRTAPRFVGADSVPWENTRQGKIKYLLHPWDNAVGKTIDCYIQEIPPGSRSGKHRHIQEELLVILDGEGYDIHNGQRYNWGENDLVCIPLMTEHQHFNTGKKTARFMGVSTRWYYYCNLGGIEQMEDCPEYKSGKKS